ncbi:MAG TPA: phosphatase PAP2 family protein [Solirubrobacteraceae bacterium]|nr:phosphatase PAP2 family protein [Solirubrobacteraceae bacterium]
MSEATFSARAVWPPQPRRASASPRTAVWLAGLCVAALALTWVLAELVPAARARDASLLVHFTQLGGTGLHEAARVILHLLDPLLFTIWALALVAIAVARGRPRIALAAAVVLAGAPIAADRLKPLLAYHHVHIAHVFNAYASWPSGHATAAGVLALCAVLVAPPRLRVAVALAGAAFVLLSGAALLIDAWHMPSDVLGGYLFAALWMALAVAALRAAERRSASARPEAALRS